MSRSDPHPDDWLEQSFVEYELVRHLFSLRFLLFIAFALLYLTLFWQAPEQLEGEVYDHDTRGSVPAASVLLSDYRGVTLDSAVTDASGRFRFSVHQRQMYTLHIRKSGYVERRVTDSEKMNTSQEVVLRIGVHRAPE